MDIMVDVSVIVARASDSGIGCSDGLPWHIPEELKYFKQRTLNKPVIMGRKTFESIIKTFGRPLPERKNIVVSRSGFSHAGADTCANLNDAIQRATQIAIRDNLDEIFVIGGSEIFKQALPLADTIYLTEIHGRFKNANAFLSDKDINFDRFEIKETRKEFLEEKFSNKTVECEFKVFKKNFEFSSLNNITF